MTTQDPRGVVTGIAADAALDESDQGQRSNDQGVPVGSADRDEDAARSGADVGETGDRGPTLREVMLGDDALTDDEVIDEGEAVGVADRNADVENSR